jgi:hypothetical protein
MNNTTCTAAAKTSTKPYRTWTKEEIIARLQSDADFLTRALVVLYDRQTADEKAAEGTKHQNGVGFNGSDASYLSYVARYVIDRRVVVSGKHLEKVQKKLVKYAGQITAHANELARVRYEEALTAAKDASTYAAYAKVSCEEAA